MIGNGRKEIFFLCLLHYNDTCKENQQFTGGEHRVVKLNILNMENFLDTVNACIGKVYMLCPNGKKQNINGEEKIQVSRGDFLVLCAAAGVVYESQDWYERENQLLERICRECDMGQFSPETQQELKDWWKERQGDISLANVIQKRLKRWKQFHRDNING